MLPGIAVGILFVYAGLSKLFLMTSAGFAENMIMPIFGTSMGLALVFAWLLIIVEVLGGVALLMRCKFPKMAYKWLVWGLIIIMVVAMLFVHLAGQDFMSLLKDLVITTVLISMLPKCGTKKCHSGTCNEGGACEGKKCDGGKCCEDGTCKA